MRDETPPLPAPALPGNLAWDLPAGRPLEPCHRGFAIDRIMARGSLEQIRGLRLAVGDDALCERLRKTGGRGLDRRRIRLFEVLLLIPRDQIDVWLADPRRKVWDER